jgi:hypothetical protein
LIYYLARQPEPFRTYLASPASALGPPAEVLTYEELRSRDLPLGQTYVFSDLERLSKRELEWAAKVWEALAAARVPTRLLNHPRRVLLRYELLAELHRRGIHEHTAHRITELGRARLPVFLKRENTHAGPATRLLWSREDLIGAVCSLSRSNLPVRRHLAIEYCETVDDLGYYTRYRAHVVGERVFPFSMRVSPHWMVKGTTATRPTDAQRQQEADYLEHNPHEDWLRDVFRIANIEFGAVDYSFEGGIPRVWEINTNPDAFSAPWPARVPFQRERFAERFGAALHAIDRAGHPHGDLAGGPGHRPRRAVTPSHEGVQIVRLRHPPSGRDRRQWQAQRRATTSISQPVRRRRKPLVHVEKGLKTLERHVGGRRLKRLRKRARRLDKRWRLRARLRRLPKSVRRLRAARGGSPVAKTLALRLALPALWALQRRRSAGQRS